MINLLRDHGHIHSICKNPKTNVFMLQGYLHHKMITSQNVSSVAHVKNFLFCRKIIFHPQDIQVFVFLTIHDLTILWHHDEYSTWDRVHFWIYLLNHNWLNYKLGQLMDISKGNNFEEFFEQFGRLGLNSRSFPI